MLKKAFELIRGEFEGYIGVPVPLLDTYIQQAQEGEEKRKGRP